MRLLYLSILSLFLVSTLIAQPETDQARLVAALLADTPIEEDLQELCDLYGGRITGTEANEKAVEWGVKKFQEAGLTAKKEDFKKRSFRMFCTVNWTSRSEPNFFVIEKSNNVRIRKISLFRSKYFC